MSAEPARRSSKTSFPHGSKLVCYFAVEDGKPPVQLHYVADKKLAVLRAHKGEIAIYAVWPGQYRSDLFVVDDLKVLAAAWKAPLDSGLSALQIDCSLKLIEEGRSFADLAEIWSVPLSTVTEALA